MTMASKSRNMQLCSLKCLCNKVVLDYQYSATEVINILFSLLRINGL
jgi:hypothetical protein